MKCLRCGREIGNKMECNCGHFYKNNLDKKRDKQAKVMLYTLISIIVLAILFDIFVVFPQILDVKNKSENGTYQKYNKYCSMKCESDDFSIKGNYCICEPGKKFLIEEK